MSTTTSSPQYRLTWSLDRREGADGAPVLHLAYALEAHEELYLADRLWDDPGQQRAPDPYGVYRFVRDGSLRLLFGDPPAPPNIHLLKYYEPLYSRVRAGETRRHEVDIKLPVDEYSALARDVRAPGVVEEVTQVHFILGYRTRASLSEDPVPPPRETPEGAGYIVFAPVYIVSSAPTPPIAVRRRTGYVARFALPGEPGPPPYTPPPRR